MGTFITGTVVKAFTRRNLGRDCGRQARGNRLLVGQDLPRPAKDALMTMVAERRYRIIVAGGSARTLVDIIEGIEIESCEAGWTCFQVSVRDESEFYGLLHRFEDLALHVVSIEQLSGSALPRPDMKPGDVA